METVGGNYKFIYNMIEQPNRYALHFLFKIKFGVV